MDRPIVQQKGHSGELAKSTSETHPDQQWWVVLMWLICISIILFCLTDLVGFGYNPDGYGWYGV